MITVFGDNVLLKKIKKEDEQVTKSGLIVAVSDFDMELPRAEVIGKGSTVPDYIEIGDTILHAHNLGAEVTDDDGQEYIIMIHQAIHGKVS